MVRRVDERPKQLLVGSLMALAFLLACGAAVRPWVARWVGGVAPLDRGARRALFVDPGNDRFQAVLATVYHYSLLLRDYPTALTYYHSTLRSNPLDSISWLRLGKLYQQLKRPREADKALRLVGQLAPNDSTIMWETTLAYLEEGQLHEALHTLTQFISSSADGDARARGYDLALSLLSLDEVLDRVLPADVTSYTQYAQYLLDRNREEEAIQAWGRINEIVSRIPVRVDPNLQLRMVDLFMARRKYVPAHEVWMNLMREMEPDAAPSGANLVSNGSFERGDTLGRGFDWKIGGGDGVACDFDTSMRYEGRQSLRLSFSKVSGGFSNVLQVVLVRPDSVYTIEAYIRTQGLDGSPRIHFEVTDPLKGPLARTETVSGTGEWTKVRAAFRTPAKSQVVILRLRSEPTPRSIQVNSATAWIDKVSMTQAH
ncbi:MAG: carbohydrate binding domain-containing protein [candidate division NC10 bacterium]|nr:carbohydrate binding domain-containing protein [candidate division NC10 bacterium]